MIGPLTSVAILLAFIGLLAGVNLVAARDLAHPEVCRKTLHISMGLIAATFPWLHPDPLWFAVSMAGILTILVSLKFHVGLRKRFGAVFYGVNRRSSGELYFALSVIALYLIARDTPTLYVIPILVMTIPDALAALAGTFYGKNTYATLDGHKSLEGSALFFVSAVTVIAGGLVLTTSLGILSIVLVAMSLGLITTVIEGASWGGLDNISLPTATWVSLGGVADPMVADSVVWLSVLVTVLTLAAGGATVLFTLNSETAR